MTLKEYQQKALKTWQVKNFKTTYLRLGVRGECGEVCDKFKKLIRDNGWDPSTPVPREFRRPIGLELGDIMWYAAVGAFEHNTYIMFTEEGDNAQLNDIETYDNDDIIELVEDLYYEAERKSSRILVVCIASIAKLMGYTLEEICEMNIEKLTSRAERGKISGSGDER